MDIHVYHHIHLTPDSSGAITALLHTLVAQGESIMKTLDELKQALAEEKDARVAQEARANAALALLQKTVTDLANNPAIPDDVVDGIKAETAQLQSDFPAPAPADAGAGETPVP